MTYLKIDDDCRLIATDPNASDLELTTTFDTVRESTIDPIGTFVMQCLITFKDSAEFFAEKNTTYVLIPSTYSGGLETRFMLTLFSNNPIEIKPLVVQSAETAIEVQAF